MWDAAAVTKTNSFAYTETRFCFLVELVKVFQALTRRRSMCLAWQDWVVELEVKVVLGVR